MDLLVLFLTVISLISTESAKSAKVKWRLNILENQVNKMKSRVSSETSKLQVELNEVSSTVLHINKTLNKIENVCRNDEKLKLREAFYRIDQQLEENSQNNTIQITLEIQKLRSEYSGLKEIIHTLDTAVEKLQEKMTNQIETSAKEIKTNITEELRRLVNAHIKDFKNSTENKYEPPDDIKTQIEEQIPDSTTPLVNRYECPARWIRRSQFCYRYFKDSAEYSEAQRVCADKGASVVDLQLQAEAEFVHGLTGNYSYWIGLTDMGEEGVYKWDRTDAEALFVHWGLGEPEPDDQNDAFDCVFVNSSCTWGTIYCDDTYNFVCKKIL